MSGPDARPVPRRQARPAADESVDPIDVMPTAAVPSTDFRVGAALAPEPQLAPRPGPADTSEAISSSISLEAARATVTLNVRVSPEVDALVRRAMRTRGESKRAIVERALRQVYG